MASAYDPAFDALVMAAPVLVDNASDRLYPIGELEGDRCECGNRIPGDVERCDDCAPCPHQSCRFVVGHDPLCPERQGGAA